MSRSVITKGCKTTTGGMVLSGVSNLPLFHSPITQIGTQATCPACKKGIGTIEPVEPVPFTVDHVQAALEGDIVACGCPKGSNTVIANRSSMTVSKQSNGHITVFEPTR
ncbi:PAAR domain-containing protein [Vibrio hyugaensis]|uniref:PAAR domain-containing protein n=1 Tax=Vibrio hyugaensis TaxID=1534743 RepID=UPI000CE4CEF4|nr:PAAR domain-containing protein [Vibrio hyugaensis]